MRLLYNITIGIRFFLSAPLNFCRWVRKPGWRDEFNQKCGRYNSVIKQGVTNRHLFWFHAVSAEEVNLCTQLIAALESRVPNLKMIVSTSTAAGMEELQRQLPWQIQKIFLPDDRRQPILRTFKTMFPQSIVLLHPDLRPNFLWHARQCRVPLYLVQTVASQPIRRRYGFFQPLYRPIIAAFSGVACQNEAEAAVWSQLGCRPEAIHVVGDLNFPAVKLEELHLLNVPALLRQLGLSDEARVLLGLNIEPGEEQVLADAFLRLRPRFPNLFLVLMPARFARSKEVGRALDTRGIKFVYRKDITAQTQFPERKLDCLVVNTTGGLKKFCEQAEVIFLGNSLAGSGDQNPLETAVLGKPMVFGPLLQPRHAVVKPLLEQEGAIQIQNAGELHAALAELLADPSRAAELGRNALRLAREIQGPIERTVQMMIAQLRDSVYLADHPLNGSDKQPSPSLGEIYPPNNLVRAAPVRRVA